MESLVKHLITYTPFEQFEIIPVLTLLFSTVDISPTNYNILLTTIVILLVCIYRIVNKSYSYIANNYQLIIEILYKFVYDVVIEQARRKAIRFLPHFFALFMLILVLNMVGLLPFNLTISAHIITTFTLSLSYIIALIIIGLLGIGKQFLYMFYPPNMGILLPLLSCIEVLSFCLRPISLGVRLFANMLAGHILLHILGEATVYVVSNFVLVVIPLIGILLAVGCLEIGISFLQAYIFVVLLAIYLKDSF